MSNLLALGDFVVKRRPKLFEVRVGYDVYDAQGAAVLGTVEQVGRDNLEKLARPKREDNARTFMELCDSSGPLLLMTHVQAAKSSLLVQRPDGTELGRFTLQNLLGKSKFAITFMSGSGGADAPPEPDMKGLSMAARTWRNKSFAMV